MTQIPMTAKIYLCTGTTDMRKGAYGLSIVSQDIMSKTNPNEVVIVFRGRRSDKIKILWWDGQGFCLLSKYLEQGKFPWYNGDAEGYIGITGGQLSMLMEGIDWRAPRWSSAPEVAA